MFALSTSDVMKVNQILSPYLNHEKVQKMKTFMQHGSITTLQHCINVALVSYAVARIFHFKLDLVSLLIGALLHDFYLYDWHDGRMRLEGIHGFSHPIVARNNAAAYFRLNKKELNIIESHMFPLTAIRVPKSKEAFIVNFADKYCAVKETLHKTILRSDGCLCVKP